MKTLVEQLFSIACAMVDMDALFTFLDHLHLPAIIGPFISSTWPYAMNDPDKPLHGSIFLG